MRYLLHSYQIKKNKLKVGSLQSLRMMWKYHMPLLVRVDTSSISFESILEVFGQFEMCLNFDQVLQEADPEMRFVYQ